MKTPLDLSPRRLLKGLRRSIGRRLERALIGTVPVTLIAEDCWGGEFCRTFGCAYTTPLAGAFILSGDYLNFLENFNQPDAFDLEAVDAAHRYPVGRTPYATIHFMHARSWDEVVAAWPRRVARINRARLFFKIDFGKSGYTQADVERWNALALPNAIALLPPTARLGLDFSNVHQGCPMKKWTYHGGAMFHLSRRMFDFHHWIRTGAIRQNAWNQLANLLFWDALSPTDWVAALFPAKAGRSASHRHLEMEESVGSFGSRRAAEPLLH